MASTIGIKIANGEFYSILQENTPVKKRLLLTTVHDKQQSVQIDLYKSSARSMVNAVYIGSLVLENIKPLPKGEPSIEMFISSSEDGDITAEAMDLDASVQGERQTLTVSLKSFDEDNREYEIPDFELESGEAPPAGLYEKDSKAKEKEGRRFPWLIVILAILLLTAIGLVIWIFFFNGLNSAETAASKARQTETVQAFQPEPPPPQTAAPSQPASPPETPTPPDVQPEVPPPQAAPQPPVIKAPAQAPASAAPARRERAAPPVASYNVPSVIPREGVPYRIRYGDTLWDIAEAFYRNPWLYPRIARFNNIRNPDLIISGTTIRVPPRN